MHLKIGSDSATVITCSDGRVMGLRDNLKVLCVAFGLLGLLCSPSRREAACVLIRD